MSAHPPLFRIGFAAGFDLGITALLLAGLLLLDTSQQFIPCLDAAAEVLARDLTQGEQDRVALGIARGEFAFFL